MNIKSAMEIAYNFANANAKHQLQLCICMPHKNLSKHPVHLYLLMLSNLIQKKKSLILGRELLGICVAVYVKLNPYGFLYRQRAA